jgi:hypothetical protein
MSMASAKKRLKQRARQKAETKRRLLLQRRRRYKDDFPGFTWRTDGAPDRFVQAVRQAVETLDFRDRNIFPEQIAALYKAAKRFGGALAMPVVANGIVQPAALALGMHLGQVIFDRIPGLLSWIPFNDVQVMPRGKDIVVEFRSLLQAKGLGGTTYYSRHKPTLNIDGRKKIVGFSEHSIRQICDRVVPTWRTYRGLGNAFAILDQCIHFERAELHGGQLAFTLYDECCYGFFSGAYVDEVLGGWDGRSKGHYYRVGYCPAVVGGDFVKAKTLLFPGHRSTPEYSMIGRLALSHEEKERMRAEARRSNIQRLRDTRDFSLVKRFHDNGIPQVIQTVEQFYKETS